jgi:hypothetical protein
MLLKKAISNTKRLRVHKSSKNSSRCAARPDAAIQWRRQLIKITEKVINTTKQTLADQ